MPCIRSALLKGYIPTPILAPRIVGAGAQWVDWHHDFALNQLPAAAAADEKLLKQAAARDSTAEVFIIDNTETALQVGCFLEHACAARLCTCSSSAHRPVQCAGVAECIACNDRVLTNGLLVHVQT